MKLFMNIYILNNCLNCMSQSTNLFMNNVARWFYIKRFTIFVTLQHLFCLFSINDIYWNIHVTTLGIGELFKKNISNKLLYFLISRLLSRYKMYPTSVENFQTAIEKERKRDWWEKHKEKQKKGSFWISIFPFYFSNNFIFFLVAKC